MQKVSAQVRVLASLRIGLQHFAWYIAKFSPINLKGYFFPVLNNWWGGYVFILFTMISAFFFVMVTLFIPETKDLEVDEVWGSRRD